MAVEDIILDMRSFKSMMGLDVKVRGWRAGGVGAMLGEGDRGGWDGEDGIHMLLAQRVECHSTHYCSWGLRGIIPPEFPN